MQSILEDKFGNSSVRLKQGLVALKKGQGLLLVDDADRENEGDLIFPAKSITEDQMALLIRECSGIVCLALTEERRIQLDLPMMVRENSSRNQTAFTVSIEAKEGVSTGVSAADRVQTIKSAIQVDAKPSDLARPGHVFPLLAREKGVLARRGHTEGAIDLMQLAGLFPAAVLCELTNEDGSMARLPQIIDFALRHDMLVLTMDDVVSGVLEGVAAQSC